jgi:hypothetical protein
LEAARRRYSSRFRFKTSLARSRIAWASSRIFFAASRAARDAAMSAAASMARRSRDAAMAATSTTRRSGGTPAVAVFSQEDVQLGELPSSWSTRSQMAGRRHQLESRAGAAALCPWMG